MKFYNRESELDELKRIQNLSFNNFSRMTVVTGRRRIGKTSLVMKSVESTPTVYLFVTPHSGKKLFKFRHAELQIPCPNEAQEAWMD